jgi:hypothetical protein
MNVDDCWTPPDNEKSLGGLGHAVCIISYDDNKYGGAYEIMNSWGESWGNGGYTWIAYDTLDNYIRQAWVLKDEISEYANPVEWTGAIKIETKDKAAELAVRLSRDGVYQSRMSVKSGTQLHFQELHADADTSGPIYLYIYYTDNTYTKTVQVWPAVGGRQSAALKAPRSIQKIK